MKTEKDFSTFNPLSGELIAFKRKLFESLYSGKLTAWEEVHTKSTDPHSALMEKEKVIYLEDEPCRIIRQFGPATEGKPDTYDTTIKVMLAPEKLVPAGAILKIDFQGHTKYYRHTSEPVVHSDHQTLTCEVYRPNRANKA